MSTFYPKRSHPTPRSRAVYKPKTTAQKKARMTAFRRKKAGLNKVEKKQVKTIIAARKELKYCPNWRNYDHYDPLNYSDTQLAPILATTILPNVYDVNNGVSTIVGFQTGNYLNVVSQQLDTNLTASGQPPCMNVLGGYGMERGDTSTTIDGNEVYFNAGKINIQINSVIALNNAGQVNDAVGPLCFRVIHVKAKKDAAGTSPSVSGQLFRDMTNDNAGFMSDMTQRQLFHDFNFNRQRFTVVNDKRFKLSQPVQPAYAGTSANQPVRNYPYPSQKNLTLYLDKPKKKLRMGEVDNGLNNYFEPTNYDFVHYVFVICCREQITSADFSNTAKCWTITTQGQSTYREA